ncbi:hypothetical protein C461_03302 [Halorubrum aidingense JCM 13560]|uniref:RelE toxin-related domain-containing protein n=1 Tax=Halorubrum aidingense JCM 13560 TaxID=1230454 RepID=M0PHT8_9EURY|nr:hypothetical protein [Halorubrum aidingense]EMA69169.1 hypothetical protein C461_03302 [Halorubrum aidingense JCM 13560]
MSAQQTRYTAKHATDQFRIRATGGAAVATAWQRGLSVEIPEEAPVPRHDEARYDARSDLVVFRRKQTLTTCYGLDSEHLTNIHGVAVAAAVDAQYGTSYCSRIDSENLEEVN